MTAQPISLQELSQKLLQLNNPENPFVVKVDNNIVTATWNLVDAKWYKLFAKTGMAETFEMIITLDETKHQGKYKDRTGKVTWEAGVPTVSYEIKKFQGKQLYSVKGGKAWGVKEDLSVGKIYDFDFDVKKIKQPIFQIIENAGWKMKRNFLEKLFIK